METPLNVRFRVVSALTKVKNGRELTLGLPFWGRCHLIEVSLDRDERVPPNITGALTLTWASHS